MRLDSADVVVVGGGTIGVTTAYELSNRGYDVVLVEQRYLAYGASGRNAGWINVGTRDTGIALDMARTGAAMYTHYSEVLGDSFDYRRHGSIMYFYTPRQRQLFSKYVDLRMSQGVEMQLLTREEVRDVAPLLPDSVIGAAFCPEDAQISSPRFVRALGDHCRRSGVRIYEQTPATGFVMAGAKATGVQTTRGPVHAQMVIWATGAWSTLLAEYGFDVPIQPTRLGVLMTEPIHERLNVVALGPSSALQLTALRRAASFEETVLEEGADPRAAGRLYMDLIVQSPDGSLQVGSPHDFTGSFNQHTSLLGTRLMVDGLLDRWPHLESAGVTGLWSGLLPLTADTLPIVDRLPGIESVLLAAGHAFGNAEGPSTAVLLSEIVAGEPTSFDTAELSLGRAALSTPEKALL